MADDLEHRAVGLGAVGGARRQGRQRLALGGLLVVVVVVAAAVAVGVAEVAES
jgi:hypothetical protein